jgi:hypothetical protein
LQALKVLKTIISGIEMGLISLRLFNDLFDETGVRPETAFCFLFDYARHAHSCKAPCTKTCNMVGKNGWTLQAGPPAV